MRLAVRKMRILTRWALRFVKWFFAALLLYVIALCIGLVPVNNGFRPAADGVKVYLVSNAVHADIIVPKISAVKDWTQCFAASAFGDSFARESHVAFGWGDRGFFLETETWDDLKLSTVANALLLPSNSCVHVSFTRPEYYANVVSVTISEVQYKALVEHLEETFQQDVDGEFIQIPGYAYSTNDAFFDANGRYHLFNTCNSWVGRGLRTAGVRAPWYSPMPRSPMLYLSNEELTD